MVVTFSVGVIGLAVVFAFFVLWALAIVRLIGGQPLLPYEPRRPVPWGLIDLALMVLVLFLMMFLSQYLLRGQLVRGAGGDDQPFTLQQNMLIIAADAVLKIVTMLIVTPIIMLRNGCTWRDLGVVPSKAGRDIAIGLAAFCMLAPIVFAIQGVLTQLQPYKHPLIEMMSKTPDLQLFFLLCFSAAILAPISEEWAFRVLLQGWLEKMVTYTGGAFHVFFGELAPAEPIVLDEKTLAGPSGEIPVTTVAASPEGITYVSSAPPPPQEIQWLDPANPYMPPQALPETAAYGQPLATALVPEFQPPPLWKQWLPIGLSALIFALMHFSHGLAWIPLSILALGLGYIYQRTHRILPSITVHFCLNALSTAGIWVQMFEAQQA